MNFYVRGCFFRFVVNQTFCKMLQYIVNIMELICQAFYAFVCLGKIDM